MKLYRLEPEVPGGLGDNTVSVPVANQSFFTRKYDVTFLHLKFEGWLGDELLETHPCFVVTENLADSIGKSGLTGYQFDKLEVSTSCEYEGLFADQKVPALKRLLPLGRVSVHGDLFSDWTGHDFCLDQTSSLVITEVALQVLKTHVLQHCEIREITVSK